MENKFMKHYKSRLIKALLVGVAFVAFVLVSPLISGQSPFSALPWYLIPVVLILTVLYGTGWYFAFNLIKRVWRKFLRVGRNASIRQVLTGRGIWIGLLYGMICLVIGCFISFIVGNYFMVCDYLLAKQSKPPVSLKYKFDSDLEYSEWQKDVGLIRTIVKTGDMMNNADIDRQMWNEKNLSNIENGNVGVVITDYKKEDGETVEKNTVVF